MATRSSSIKLLFDETIGPPIAKAVIELLKFTTPDLDAVTISEYMGSGTKDPHWVFKASQEQRFVITGDRGKKKDGAPLDILLPYHGVSGAFMTGVLHSKRKQFEKARAVISLWPDILDAANGTAGMRYSMRIVGKSFDLVEWPLDDKAKRRQVELLGKFPENLWEAKHAPEQ